MKRISKNVGIKGYKGGNKLLYIKDCIHAGNYVDGLRVVKTIDVNGIYCKIEWINTVLNFYGSFGKMDICLRLFGQIACQRRTHVTVNIVLKWLLKGGKYNEVIKIYESAGIRDHDNINISYIKACMYSKKEDKAKKLIHELNRMDRYEMGIELITTLIDFYGCINELEMAEDIYKRMERSMVNVICLGAIMKCCIHNEKSSKAIQFYNEFRDTYKPQIGRYNGYNGMSLKSNRICNDVTDSLYIKACKNSNNWTLGSSFIEMNRINDYGLNVLKSMMDFYFHFGEINRAKYLLDVFSKHKNYDIELFFIKLCADYNQWEHGKQFIDELNIDDTYPIKFINTVLHFYGKSDNLNSSLKLFNSISYHKINVVTLNIMMKYLVANGQNEDAIIICENNNHVHYNDFTTIMFIKACINGQEYTKGIQYIEKLKIIQNIGDKNIEFVNIISEFYCNFNDVPNVLKMYQETNDKIDNNIVNLSISMKCCIRNGFHKDALDLFETFNGIHNDVSKLLFTKACIHLNNFNKVYDNIDIIDINNYNDCSIELATVLIEFYILCRNDKKAIEIYESLTNKCNDITALSIVKSCTQIKNFIFGNSFIQKLNIKDINNHKSELMTTLLDFYGHSGDVHEATKLFDSILDTNKNIIIINSMMNVFKMNKEYDQALNLFFEITNGKHYSLDKYTYSIAIYCCGELACLTKLSQIIDKATQTENEHILKDHMVSASIISTYVKHGMFNDAVSFYEHILNKDNDIIVYSSMLDCYAKMGDIPKTLQLFDKIVKLNIELDDIIYGVIINACTHSGYLNDALRVFNKISHDRIYKNYNIITTMIDCLSRKNYIKQAETLYMKYGNNNNINSKNKLIMLRCILFGCVLNNDVNGGQRIFDKMTNIINSDSKLNHVRPDYTLLLQLRNKEKKQFN